MSGYVASSLMYCRQHTQRGPYVMLCHLLPVFSNVYDTLCKHWIIFWLHIQIHHKNIKSSCDIFSASILNGRFLVHTGGDYLEDQLMPFWPRSDRQTNRWSYHIRGSPHPSVLRGIVFSSSSAPACPCLPSTQENHPPSNPQTSNLSYPCPPGHVGT